MSPLTTPELWVRGCCLISCAVATLCGISHYFKDWSHKDAQNDNFHRFFAGHYIGARLIATYNALTVRQQSTLTYILALGNFLGGCARLISMSKYGLPKP